MVDFLALFFISFALGIISLVLLVLQWRKKKLNPVSCVFFGVFTILLSSVTLISNYEGMMKEKSGIVFYLAVLLPPIIFGSLLTLTTFLKHRKK